MYGRDPRYSAQGLLVERPGRDARDHRPALDPLPADRAGGDLGQRRLRRAAAPGRLVRRRPRVRRVRLAPPIPTTPPSTCARPSRSAACGPPSATPTCPRAGWTGSSRLPPRSPTRTLGVAELVVWHWWQSNGLPIILDPRLGTEDDLRAALGSLPRARRPGLAVREPPPAARQRRDAAAVAAPQRRAAAGPGRLDLRPRLPAALAGPVHGHPRDDARVGARAGLARGRPGGVRAAARPRCHLDLLRPVLVLVRAQLQRAPRRPSGRRGRSAARARPGGARPGPQPRPARHLLRRDAHRR